MHYPRANSLGENVNNKTLISGIIQPILKFSINDFSEILFSNQAKQDASLQFHNILRCPHQKSAMIISKSNLNWKKYLVTVLFPGGIKESEGETAHYVSGNFLPKQRVPLLHVRHR